MEKEQTKKCRKCKKDIEHNIKKCPHCQSKQDSGKQTAVGCISIAIILAFLGFGSFMCSIGGTPAMVDISQTKNLQLEQAEKIKPLPYIASKRFIKKQLKVQISPKFKAFDKNMVTWLNGNEFTCLINVEFQDSSGKMIFSDFQTKIKYSGKDKWILLNVKKIKSL